MHAKNLVPVADEIALAREYLFLEKARLGERLSFELPQPVAEVQMPGLTLQPLEENAVRHGISRRMVQASRAVPDQPLRLHLID